MEGYQLNDFNGVEFSVAMTVGIDRKLVDHLDKGGRQEDLAFAYWRPSRGCRRYTAILHSVVLPEDGDRILQGNVAFTSAYLTRVLDEVPEGSGIALLHSHLGPGWQRMSGDDRIAERDRLGGAVAARTGVPILGLTWGRDGSWSARFWLRRGPNQYSRRTAATVRVVGRTLTTSFQPLLRPTPKEPPAQTATISVWRSRAQADVARCRVGIVGLGSVGSLVAEALSRLGLQDVVLIDHDVIEERNLDRTLGTTPDDAVVGTPKVEVARRTMETSHTALRFTALPVPVSVLTQRGLEAALDCDVIFSCVDRPWPRSLLNIIAKAHLIPVVNGGIFARVTPDGKLLHVDWGMHTVTAASACLYCLDELRRGDVASDREGKLDDPDYIAGMPEEERERFGRRNVFAFSMSVAAHEVLQFVGLVSGVTKVGGIGRQRYSAYPGRMSVEEVGVCDPDCDGDRLTASATNLLGYLIPTGGTRNREGGELSAQVV
jgi:molybdopterin-synthase adenylyltransferase